MDGKQYPFTLPLPSSASAVRSVLVIDSFPISFYLKIYIFTCYFFFLFLFSSFFSNIYLAYCSSSSRFLYSTF